MIRSPDDVTLSGFIELVYDSLAAAVLWGAALGVLAVLLSVAARGGDR